MSSQGSSSENYELQHRRELLRDLDQGTFVGWVEEERTTTRRKDMDQSVKEEVKKISSSQEGQTATRSRTRKPTFVGSINAGRAFSHNMQGPIPPVPDLSSFPAVEEALCGGPGPVVQDLQYAYIHDPRLTSREQHIKLVHRLHHPIHEY